MLASVSLLVFVSLAVDPGAEISDDAREWIEAMKSNRRGPYRGVLWYCEDGTVLPPKMSACVPHGGGIQHGVLSEQAEKLAQLGLHVGTVLASLEPEQLERNDYYRSRALVVETHLERSLDGWVLQEAKTYRGFRQIEDEQIAAEELLAHLARSEQVLTSSRLLLLRLFWSLPIDVGGRAANEIRKLAGELGDADPSRFGDLRFKIHAVPDPSDIDAVDQYATSHTGDLAQKATRLATKMRRFYSPEGLRERLTSVRSRIRDETVGARIDAFLAVDPADTSAIFQAGAELIRAAGEALVPGASRQRGIDNRRLLYAAYVVETIWLSAATETSRRRMSRGEALGFCRDMLRSAATLGWLSQAEMQRAVITVDRMQVGFTDQYDAGVRELLRIDELAAAGLLEQLGPALQRYGTVEPAASAAVDDQLRHGLLRPFSVLLARLSADVERVRRGGHDVRGLPSLVDFALRGEVSGVAAGELCGSDDSGCERPTGVAVSRHLPAALPTAAGVLMDERWCDPTHLSFVARKRGVVVACAGQEVLRAVEKLVGQDVILGVSRQGRVALGPASAFPNLLSPQTAVVDPTRLREYVDSLDANAEVPGLWLDMKTELP